MTPYPGYIFDLDGTLFRGEEAIPGAADALRRLRARGAQLRYLTNNSTRSQSFYANKLSELGFEVDPSEVFSSGLGTALYLRGQGIETAFVVGEDGLKQTLTGHGIREEFLTPEAVVVGLCRSFTYDLMNEAMQLIRKGARFVATNADATYPVEGGAFIPGSGSVVAAIQTCSETDPFVVGKPNPFLVELVLKDLQLPPDQVLVVGDRMDTDIESGRRAGCPTCLVLTGHAASAPPGQDWLADVTEL